MNILVTLCIPTFNGCDFLGRAIRSAINQTFNKNKYEIVVIDDGSSDRSDIILEFIEFNKYIKDTKQIFANLSGNSFKLSIKELKYKYTMRKFLTYDKVIKKYKFLRTSHSKISRLMKKINF
tara:strand:+ start:597 stop:962 length:366 start_codon:yes stop_codon:yes gene_type:complete